jgi:3-hydroxyacyl-[acyl-carrier-protein] dehydratase
LPAPPGGGEATLQLGPAEIAALLRHRYPFLLVDRIVELSAERAVGIKNVTAAEPWAPGHLPGQPALPAALLIEAMAQVGGILLAHHPPFESGAAGGEGGYLAGLDRVELKCPVHPGDQLVIEAVKTAAARPFARVHATARVNGEKVAAGEISYYLP